VAGVVSGIDAVTGEVAEAPQDPLERERMRVEVLESDLRLAEDEIRHLRRSIAAYKAQLSRQTTESDHGRIARLIAQYYVARLHKTKTWKFGEKRQKTVLARLKEDYAPIFICRAIDGLAVGYYINPETGVRYNDLELVCRNEVMLEKYYQLAERNSVPTLLDAAWRQDLGATSEDSTNDSLTTSDGDPRTETSDHEAVPEYQTDHDVAN